MRESGTPPNLDEGPITPLRQAALKPDETLAEEGAERTKAWKAATRQYGQIEAARRV